MHSTKLVLVVGDDRAAERQRLGGDQQVVGANRSARPLETDAQVAIDHVRRRFERQHLEDSEHRLELVVSRCDAFFAAP